MAKTPGPFIVVYGDDDFLQDRFVAARVAAWKDRQVQRRDASTLSAGELVSLCESRSFFEDDGGRAVILDNAQDLKADKALEQYIVDKDPTNASCILVAVIRGNKISAAWVEAAKKGRQIAFLKLKPWESQKAVERIIDEATALGLKLDQGMAQALYKNLGDNLRATVNELNKLVYVVGERRLVKKEHLQKVLVSNTETEPKHVSEAALSKDLTLTANRLSRIFKLSGESACVPVVSSCLYLVEKVLITRQMMDRGDEIKTIAARFEMHEYACKMNIVPLAHKHTVKSLLGHMQHLCRLEAQVKGAARSKRTLVELAVLAIAA